MSVTTGFNFAAFSRDLVRETHGSKKDGIALSAMSSDDMRKMGVVEIAVSSGKEIPGNPCKPVMVNGTPKATLWDARLGNVSMRPFPITPCATCAEANEGFGATGGGGGGGGGNRNSSSNINDRCAGHYGYISMPRRVAYYQQQPQNEQNQQNQNQQQQQEPEYIPYTTYQYVYSPMLFEELCRIVRAQCFFCNDFRAPAALVHRYFCALALFDVGLVGDALHFLQVFPASNSTSSRLRRLRTEDDDDEDENDGDKANAGIDSDSDDEGLLAFETYGKKKDNDEDSEEEDNKNKKNKKNKSNKSKAKEQQQGKNKKDNKNKKQEEAVAESVDDVLIRQMEQYCAKLHSKAKEDGLIPKKADLEIQQRTVSDLRSDIIRDAIQTLAGVPKDCRRCGAENPKLTTKQGQIYAQWTAKTLTNNCTGGLMTQEERQEIEGEMAFHSRQRVRLDQCLVRDRLRAMFSKQNTSTGKLLGKLYPRLGEPAFASVAAQRNPADAYDLFFLDCVLVPPIHLRLAQGAEVLEQAGKIAPDDCSRKLSEIINFVQAIEELLGTQRDAAAVKQLENNLCHLQLKVNELYNRVLDSFAKKKGLFRNNMMGKRVNQACRSVISPDFTVEPNQLLLPRSFATRLTFPETVTLYCPERTEFLKRCVINGPYVYPGAVAIEIRKPGGYVDVKSLFGRSLQEKERAQLASECFALVRPDDFSGYEVRVHRHVVDDDRVIFNRQPTLHKVSMMSFRARVLSGLKTIRFHYVSAKSFNADFDGDEMNVHVPQSIDARAEMDSIMDSNLNYLLPTSGKPIRGLIQDHCDAGVLLAARDKFFEYGDFVQLALLGIGPYISSVGVEAMKQLRYVMPMPAIMKPKRLWTGKQIFSVLFRFITMSSQKNHSNTSSNESNNNKKAQHFSYGIAAKRQTQTFSSAWSYRNGVVITPEQFKDKLPDNPVIVLNSELVCGVLDKSQTGPTNLSIAHVVYDVFGPHHTGVFFGALGRLLTYGLQREGFSMGIDDMMMGDDKKRSEMLREIDVGAATHHSGEPLGFINSQASKLQKHFFPRQLRVPFPYNQLVMMTISGAKGSPTNAVQMNLVIGQQTFDSKRIARTLSGKTLPSFFIGDQRARSFGFAMGRFVSGIRPAEYTITAMAGREGLIDTAIKTARSGELERCLMKGLESVRTHWGGSVRNGDGALIQTRYGGDGLDPAKSATLKEFDMLQRNSKVILNNLPHGFRNETETEQLADDLKRIFAITSQEARKSKSIPHSKKTDKELDQVIKARLEWMRVDAGEPVGVLASQAIGEPSTQMTLNTFHSVGTTVSHVSQGIPRLRELMLHASVKSPAVFLPITTTENGEMEAIEEIRALMTPMPLVKFIPTSNDLFVGSSGSSASAASASSSSNQHEANQQNAVTESSCIEWSISRPPGATQIQLVMAFDQHVLIRHQEACKLPRQQHIELFRHTLKRFAIKFRALIQGKKNPYAKTASSSSSGGEGGKKKNGDDENEDADEENKNTDDILLGGGDERDILEATETGATLMGRGEFAAEGDDDEDFEDHNDIESSGGDDAEIENSEHDENSDDEDDSGDDDETAVAAAVASKKKSDKKNKKRKSKEDDALSSEDEDYEDLERFRAQSDNDDKDGNIDDNVDNKNKKKNKTTTGGGGGLSSSSSSTSYSRMATILSKKDGKTSNDYKISVATKNETNPQAPFFSVLFQFNLPSRTIAVVSDMLREALAITSFHMPSYPQVESISYIEGSGSSSSSQLVFKGEGCSMRQIASVVAPLSVFYPGLDIDKMTSSDFRDVLRCYGVEATYHALLAELKELFKAYSVDFRHLSLVTDVATHHGLWKPFRFSGVAALSSSPLYQMTVAASGKFLRNAVSHGVTDALGTVSASIMAGEKPMVGTASSHVSRSSATQTAFVKERVNATLKPMKTKLKPMKQRG